MAPRALVGSWSQKYGQSQTIWTSQDIRNYLFIERYRDWIFVFVLHLSNKQWRHHIYATLVFLLCVLVVFCHVLPTFKYPPSTWLPWKESSFKMFAWRCQGVFFNLAETKYDWCEECLCSKIIFLEKKLVLQPSSVICVRRRRRRRRTPGSNSAAHRQKWHWGTNTGTLIDLPHMQRWRRKHLLRCHYQPLSQRAVQTGARQPGIVPPQSQDKAVYPPLSFIAPCVQRCLFEVLLSLFIGPNVSHTAQHCGNTTEKSV